MTSQDKERLETLLAKNKEQLQVKNKSLGEVGLLMTLTVPKHLTFLPCDLPSPTCENDAQATRTVRELQNVKKDLELQITSLQAEVQRLQEEKSDVENKMVFALSPATGVPEGALLEFVW